MAQLALREHRNGVLGERHQYIDTGIVVNCGQLANGVLSQVIKDFYVTEPASLYRRIIRNGLRAISCYRNAGRWLFDNPGANGVTVLIVTGRKYDDHHIDDMTRTMNESVDTFPRHVMKSRNSGDELSRMVYSRKSR